MDKFEEKKMMKKRPFAKSNWCDWLINFIPEPIKIRLVVLKTKL